MPKSAIGGGSKLDRAYVWAIVPTLFLVMVLVVDPRGNFPLVDDWSFGRTVKTLTEEGRLAYDGWNAPTLFLQVLWGALFSLPFGFSFDALRISTLIASLSGLIGTYVLLREARAGWLLALFGALALLVNPVWFTFSFTFMTDVPFAALAIVSAIFFARALRSGDFRPALIGTLFACAATLVRQVGIALPIGYAVAQIAFQRRDAGRLPRAVAPLIGTVAVLAIYNWVTTHFDIVPTLHGAKESAIAGRFAELGLRAFATDALMRSAGMVIDVALYLLPVLAIMLGLRTKGRLSLRVSGFVAVVGCVLFAYLFAEMNDPRGLGFFRLGTISLRQASALMQGMGEPIARLVPLIVALGCLGATFAVLALGVVAAPRGRDLARQETADLAVALFAFVSCATYLLPFTLVPEYYERYLLLAIPLGVLCIVSLTNPSTRDARTSPAVGWIVAAVLFTLGYGVLAIVDAHDLMARNRVRWEAVHFLIDEMKVPPEKIDGGFEVNGWYLYPTDAHIRARYDGSQLGTADTGAGSTWRNEGAEYRVLLRAPSELKRLEAGTLVWSRPFSAWVHPKSVWTIERTRAPHGSRNADPVAYRTAETG